ncbi:MAG: hypothetical protein H0T89_24370 [Deltaproteobacteria bacterium]|nr:hypothetical protein [Deltaproteobacteria bacterium]MDQ3298837.1 hypothetical protein [Myxococcota bacterium]
MARLSLGALLIVTSLAGCTSTKSVMVHRPTDTTADAAITRMWAHEIEGVARDGDWLLSRSYYAVGDLIALTTPGEDLSHASIYDARRRTVVESIGSGVREIPIADFLARNHYVIVLRPSNMTAIDQRQALLRARAKVGAAFDIGGMFGVDNPQAFYCSELVYWASQTEARSGRSEIVVTPSDLMKYGEVIYWSGKRDDSQLVQIALGRAAPSRDRIAAH